MPPGVLAGQLHRNFRRWPVLNLLKITVSHIIGSAQRLTFLFILFFVCSDDCGIGPNLNSNQRRKCGCLWYVVR